MLVVGEWRRGFEQGRWLAVLLLLAGCQGGLKPAWDPQPIDASQSVIRLEHAAFDPAQAKYLLQHDPRSDNDVYIAQYAGDGVIATLAVYRTGPSHVIEERSTESYVANLLADAELTWGETGRAASRFGSVPYRMFAIDGQPVSCVGFGRSRGESSDDRGRKSDLVFGYFCQSDARAMSAATAAELIGSVTLSGRR
jgi:hypothetical protein